jgi:hypothetical protein
VGYNDEQAAAVVAGLGADLGTQEWTIGGTASSYNSDSKDEDEDKISEELAEAL